MDSNLMGESAAVLTSCFWTASSLFFTSAGKKFGSFSVNAYRTLMAIGMLASAQVVLLGTLLPLATGGQWFWMGLSGVVGLGIGDLGLFTAYILIGPRRTLLIQASAPIFATIGAYFLLSETIPPIGLFGIAVTLSGITVVVLERQENAGTVGMKNRKTLGVLSGVVSAMGQGFGTVLSKKGMYLNSASVAMNPVSAALMRMMLAGVFIWAIALFAGKLPTLRQAITNKDGMKYTSAGALVGPFLGMTLSLVAISETATGIASTLTSLMPVFIIPVVWIIYREKTNWRGILGALITVIGVAVLFLAP